MRAVDKPKSELRSSGSETHITPQEASVHANRLRNHHEQGKDRKQELHEAHTEALETAIHTKEANHRHHAAETASERPHGPITKKQLNREFNKTMSAIQDEMPPAKRTFSKVIHTPVIEKGADFLGATVARPNALFAGAVGAFILTLGLYLFAKNVGYPLSGFESIGAFFTGWVFGLLYDYFRIMITGKH